MSSLLPSTLLAVNGIKEVADTVRNGAKVAGIVVAIAAFQLAIRAFGNLIVPIIIPDVVKEVFKLISVYTPFDAQAVFGAVGSAVAAIMSFMIAIKVFKLNERGIKSA